MITPIEIKNKEFESRFKGYDKEEVNDFLEQLYEDYQKLYKDNIELRERLSLLNESVGHYRKIEDTLHNTLIIAEKTAEETKRAAHERALMILQEAETKAREVLSQENKGVEDILRQKEDLIKEYNTFKAQFMHLLKTQESVLERINLVTPQATNRNTSNLENNLSLEETKIILEAVATREY